LGKKAQNVPIGIRALPKGTDALSSFSDLEKNIDVLSDFKFSFKHIAEGKVFGG